MGKLEKGAFLLRKKTVLVLILCGLAFAASITLLFLHEKQRLDTEFASLISGSLNVHTHQNAAQIDRAIEDAGRAIKTAEAIFHLTESAGPQDFLEQRNAANPVYIVEYSTMEQLRAEPSSFFSPDDAAEALPRLVRGETVVGNVHYDPSLGEYYLPILLGLREGGEATGAFYTRIAADDLLPDIGESAVYQDVLCSLITADGQILFNTFEPGREGNLLSVLYAYDLTEAEVNRISAIISSPEMDSTTFLRHGEVYYASADRLEYGGWHLVSFVRGADVLLRSANIFSDVVRTSTGAIIITATAAGVIFMLFVLSKKRLEEQQQSNEVLARRLQAMFEQHSALMVVIDAATREIMDVNPAMLNYFGHTREEMLGHSAQEFNLLPADIVAQRYQSELTGDAMFSSAPFRLKSGEIRLLDVYASFITEGGRRLLYAILFDVTDKERYWKELLQEKELLRTTLQSIGDGVVTTDNLGVITGMNSVAEELTGWDNGMAVGKTFGEVFILRNEETGEPVENPIQKVLQTGLIVGLANHTELVNRQGACIPIADSAAPIKAEDGQTFGVVMVFRDVSEEKKHSKEIEFLSYHDSLTGLHNRRYLEKALSRLDGPEHLPVSVIMADVNGLKITNDVFGHQAGDILLKNAADLLRSCCRASDLIARWGGDEFVVIMPGMDLEEAEAVIQRMKEAHIAVEEGSLALSLSLGCACKERAEDSVRAAVQQAEKNMYQQKLLDGKSYRNAIISTLLATLYEKSNETEEHSKRLEAYCHAIGSELQLSSKEMDELSLLALLHDIGKVGINPNILQKPGPLAPEEWEEMKRHPEIGYRIAQATPELAAVADLILSHHERWDGEGYPRELKGAEIPLACRILSVVDAYDAMTNDRAYRAAMPEEKVIAELRDNAGGQFDPGITGLLLEIIASEKESVRLEGSLV